jgi:hypothetical protein
VKDRRVKELKWEMWRIGQGGLNGLKNWSGKCKGPGEGGVDGLKTWSEKCKGLGGGIDKVKSRSGKCEGPGQRGANGCLKRKVFKKNQKHEPNIVEISHLCIVHGVHIILHINAYSGNETQRVHASGLWIFSYNQT